CRVGTQPVGQAERDCREDHRRLMIGVDRTADAPLEIVLLSPGHSLAPMIIYALHKPICGHCRLEDAAITTRYDERNRRSDASPRRASRCARWSCHARA